MIFQIFVPRMLNDLLEERALSSRGESTSEKEIEADDNPKYKQKWR